MATTNAVLIVGSGCTGLAIAQGMKRAGIPCIVFEKKAALQNRDQRDWNMGLHWGAPVLQRLITPAQWAQIQSVSVDPHTPIQEIGTLNFLNGATGEKLGNGISVPRWYRLRRSKLRKLLAEGIDIRYNKRLTNISYGTLSGYGGVTAIFEDGTQFDGRILVGVDGSKSIVRELLAGPEVAHLTRLPYAATFVQSKYTQEQALFLRSFHPLYVASPHPNGRFAFFGVQEVVDPEKPETWTFFMYISWASSLDQQEYEAKAFTRQERLEQIKALGREYTDPWKSAFEWLPGDHPCWYLTLNVWDPGQHDWLTHGGKVTLAGDAAHPMTYQRGQGLNHSITDAGKLVDAISSFIAPANATSHTTHVSQEDAIKTYETEMKKRCGEEVRLSVVNTTMLHDWARVLESPVLKTGLAAN